jgi:hypothetical protein
VAKSVLRLAGLLWAGLLLLPTASSAQSTAARPPLWRVQHGTSTVYLFGSLHVLPKDYVWTTPQIEAAKQASDRFIFEVPVDEAALKDEKQFIIEHGILAKRQTLRGALSGNEFQTYSAVLRHAGMKEEQFERFRPWLAGVVVGLAYLHGDDLNSLRGADDDLMDYARSHGRTLTYLESVRDQMQLLTNVAEPEQLKALKTMLVSLRSSRNQEQALLSLWASGDAARLSALLDAYFSRHPDAQDMLVNARNRHWLPVIRDSLARENGTTMITVGAAHIGGRNGLVALLCGEAYAVELVGENQSGQNACGPES